MLSAQRIVQNPRSVLGESVRPGARSPAAEGSNPVEVGREELPSTDSDAAATQRRERRALIDEAVTRPRLLPCPLPASGVSAAKSEYRSSARPAEA